MAKKRGAGSEEALSTAISAINDLMAKNPDTRTNEQAVQDDYYARQWAKQGMKNMSNAMMGNSGIGPDQQSLFNMMFTKKKTDYLKGVKSPTQLNGIQKPTWNGGGSSSNSSNNSNNSSNNSNNSSNNSNGSSGTTPKVPDYVGSNEWSDIVAHYFPKGAGNYYKEGGKVSRSKPASQTYADGGLVRGGGKAQRGRGRGRMV